MIRHGAADHSIKNCQKTTIMSSPVQFKIQQKYILFGAEATNVFTHKISTRDYINKVNQWVVYQGYFEYQECKSISAAA